VNRRSEQQVAILPLEITPGSRGHGAATLAINKPALEYIHKYSQLKHSCNLHYKSKNPETEYFHIEIHQ
jgi:hypothetical protein